MLFKSSNNCNLSNLCIRKHFTQNLGNFVLKIGLLQKKIKNKRTVKVQSPFVCLSSLPSLWFCDSLCVSVMVLPAPIISLLLLN